MNQVIMLLSAVALVVYSNLIVKARLNVFETEARERNIAQFLNALIVDPLIWSAIIATGLAVLLYLQALRRVDVSVAQPTMAIVFVAVPLSATIFLGESLSNLRLAGLGCIALGVLLILKSA